jgi:hypothetical protein
VSGGDVDPKSLNIAGSPQPEFFDGIVQEMRHQLKNDPFAFWKTALSNDGPIEIWEIGGKRYLYNGNHRWQAAVEEGAIIPAENIRLVDRTGSQIPTWALNQRHRLPGKP